MFSRDARIHTGGFSKPLPSASRHSKKFSRLLSTTFGFVSGIFIDQRCPFLLGPESHAIDFLYFLLGFLVTLPRLSKQTLAMQVFFLLTQRPVLSHLASFVEGGVVHESVFRFKWKD
jgi:hypothetical protein